ncbi:AraC family transcriptional regulator [Paraburkholderia sp. CNPSo 3281]|nr:AraC family transcriptional regulator [Paraburkholderia sp. CNPSo 3281]
MPSAQRARSSPSRRFTSSSVRAAATHSSRCAFAAARASRPSSKTSGKQDPRGAVVDAGIPTNQAIELTVGVLARHSSALLGEQWKPRAVHFVHQAPRSLMFHRRFFGCPLEFGSDFNGLVCATADLDCPNPAADPELARYAEDLAEWLNVTDDGSIALEVRKAIYLLLPLGQASVEQVAAHSHLSVRTMQRQLELANTSFSRLTEGVRYELAVRFMSNSRYPIGRVSGLVGYAHQGTFTNWFVGRFGMTPRDWRNNHTRWLC